MFLINIWVRSSPVGGELKGANRKGSARVLKALSEVTLDSYILQIIAESDERVQGAFDNSTTCPMVVGVTGEGNW